MEISYNKESLMGKEIKGIWFDAFVKGNLEWPQSFYTTSIRCLRAVLSDHPEKWSDFQNSNLSETQIQELGTIMSRVHHSYKIKKATKPHMTEHDEEIRGSRLDYVWGSIKIHSETLLLSYLSLTNSPKIFGKPYPSLYRGKTNRERVQDIENFLKNPKKEKQRKSLIKTLDEMITALDSPEGKSISQEWRKNFTPKLAVPEKLYIKGDIRTRLVHLVANNISNNKLKVMASQISA